MAGRDDSRLLRSSKRLMGLALAGLVLVVLVGLLIRAIPGIDLPGFPGTRTVDRSQPAVLKSIAPLKQFRAATANLQVIVDVERDASLLPSFLKGERVLFVAAGNVDAGVDFSQLDADSIRINEDRTAVEITLPAARLYDARVDPDRSRVFNRERGFIDRIESVFEDSPTEDRSLLVRSEQKLQEAAAADPELLATAERNTRDMLEGLLGGLGFTDVTVEFEAPES